MNVTGRCVALIKRGVLYKIGIEAEGYFVFYHRPECDFKLYRPFRYRSDALHFAEMHWLEDVYEALLNLMEEH